MRIAVTPGPVQLIFAVAGAVGVAMLLAAIASGYARLAYWAVGVVAAAYVASVVVTGPPDPWSIATAIALLLSAELASWSIDSRRRGRDDVAAHAARLRTIVIVSVAGFALALLAQDAAIFGPGGTGTAGVAVVAVLAAIVALGVMLWRSASPPPSGPE